MSPVIAELGDFRVARKTLSFLAFVSRYVNLKRKRRLRAPARELQRGSKIPSENISQVWARLGCDSEAGKLQADWTPVPAGPRNENNRYCQSQTVIPECTSSQETGSVMNDPKRPCDISGGVSEDETQDQKDVLGT